MSAILSAIFLSVSFLLKYQSTDHTCMMFHPSLRRTSALANSLSLVLSDLLYESPSFRIPRIYCSGSSGSTTARSILNPELPIPKWEVYPMVFRDAAMSSMMVDMPSEGLLRSASPKRPLFSANLRNSFMLRTPLLDVGVSLTSEYLMEENTSISYLARDTATFSLRPPPARLIGPKDWATVPSFPGPYPIENRMISLSSPWTVSRFLMNISSDIELSLW